MENEKAVHLSDVVFRYLNKGKRNILDHAELDIDAGSVTVIMGNSGCGKSTLAAVLAGLYPENGGVLEDGTIEVFGQDVKAMNPQQRAAYLTVMFQNPDLQFCMDTLRKEMLFCMENICIPADEMTGRVEKAAKALGVSEFLDQPLLKLSGGEKQKATLACLYVMESQAILLDECFANIDQSAAREILEMLTKMRAQGRTIIAIDHQVDLWLGVADEIVILGEGAKVLARGINKANISEYRGLFEEQGLFYPADMKRQANGHKDCDSAIEFRGLTIKKGDDRPVRKKFAGRKADKLPQLLEDAEASFPKGRMTAVLGPSGTGKTTTFLSVLGQHYYEGSILVNGVEVRETKAKKLYEQMGIVFQNPANQFITQNVKEEVIQSILVWNKDMALETAEIKAKELLEDYGLARYQKYSPYMLSQGQQRRLAVLSVLTGGQKILLLDEPTYGQDYRSAMAIMSQLREKMEASGLTVIFITHDRQLACAYADKIYELKDKKLEELQIDEDR